MALPSDYIAGTITLTNGSTAFTGTGTGWLAADFREGDIILDVEGGEGAVAVIQSITSNTAGVLAKEWEGATLTDVAYRIRYQWDSGRVAAQSRAAVEMLGNGNLQSFAAVTGPGVVVMDGPHSVAIKPETDFINGVAYNVQVDTLADRDAYDGQSEGFAVLVSDVGDGRSALYSKNSNTVGDWSDPAYITGPVGPLPDVEATVDMLPPGSTATVTPTPITGGVRLDFELPEASGFYNAGVYDIAEVYDQDDVVRHNGSSFIALQAVPAGTSPSSAFPPVDTAYWQVLAVKGNDGAGTIVSIVAGRNISVDNTTPSAPIISGIVVPSPQGRLSLLSGFPLSTSDLVGQTSIFYVPAIGPSVPVYDGAAYVARDIGTQLTLALDADSGHAGYHQSGQNFDLWAIWDSGTLRLATGPSWNAGAGSDTARGTGAGSTELESFGGLLVNKNAITARFGSASGNTVVVPARQATFLGSFRATANGQATDSVSRRLLSNAYNAVLQPLFVTDPTATHAYSTATYRSYNGDASNRIEILNCLAGILVDITASAVFTTSTPTARSSVVAVGVDSTTVAAPNQLIPRMSTVANSSSALVSSWRGYPGIGFHQLNWLQKGAGTDTQTWLGTPGAFDVGMSGVMAA